MVRKAKGYPAMGNGCPSCEGDSSGCALVSLILARTWKESGGFEAHSGSRGLGGVGKIMKYEARHCGPGRSPHKLAVRGYQCSGPPARNSDSREARSTRETTE